jgi:hypothetical protein
VEGLFLLEKADTEYRQVSSYIEQELEVQQFPKQKGRMQSLGKPE